MFIKRYLIYLLLISIPNIVLGQVDVSKIDSKVFYGAYYEDTKIGYFEDNFELTKLGSRDVFTITYKGYLEEQSDDDIFTSNFIYIYNFDMSDRRLFSYSEKHEDKIFDDKKNLINAEPLEIHTYGTSAKYIGNSKYLVRKTDGNDAESEIAEMSPLNLDSALAEANAIQNDPLNRNPRLIEVYDLYFDTPKSVSAEVQIIKEHNYVNRDSVYKHYELETLVEGISSTSFYDSNGNFLKGNISGIDVKIEPEEIATSLDEDRHLATLSSLTLKEPILNDGYTKHVTLKIYGDKLRKTLIENERQKILKETDEYDLVKFSTNELLAPNGGQPDELSEFLISSKKYDLDNVLLREINPIKSSSSLSQKEKIQTLLQFTYEYIDYQFTLNISLQDIILEMKGDCTEYAQLFVALARLNGIPAREVGGLVYNYSDKLPQFSGHAWAEVWMGDGWREVDPGWNEFNIDATHLRLSDSYFTDLGSLNERIELVSYE